MFDALLLIFLVAGLVPATLFTYSYARRSAWRTTGAGRAVMRLMTVTTVTYASSVATLAYPEFFKSDAGTAVRVVIRAAVAVVLWNLYLLLRRAQRASAPAERIDV